MNHLIVCPEYPPAEYAGGIGTYAHHISRMLTEEGETVHVITARWKGARRKEERIHDRLTIHRVGKPGLFQRGYSLFDSRIKPLLCLQESAFPPQLFSYQAGLLAEQLVERAGIDVIEGQEFEAPLYYLLLRRALGLGPKQQPPCIIHLHSPMEFIARNNDWDSNHPYFFAAKTFEDYCIRAADALLCPSRYLADQARDHYELPDGAIQVIPLPIKPSSYINRDTNTWKTGSILYVGRLERRKGILNWLQAAVTAAYENPQLRFEFVGANCLSTDLLNGEDIIASLVPKELENRFHFHGQRKQADLPLFLSEARLAVVPSRWENFPNTCLEAMGSGLPVIATREGGMVEMIEDGRTGWLAASPDARGLYEALQRALCTSEVDLANMGAAACASIQKKCDNSKVIQEHLRFRRLVFDKGAVHSLFLPRKPVSGDRSSHSRKVISNSGPKNASNGMAIVITCSNSVTYLENCLKSIRCQTQQPIGVAIIHDGCNFPRARQLPWPADNDSWMVLNRPRDQGIPIKNHGIQKIIGSGVNPACFCFLREEDRLHPRFIETCTTILAHCPEVGLVSGWIQFMGRKGHIQTNQCLGFPRQWIINEIAPFSAIRTEALMEVGQFRQGLDDEFETWDLFNAVLAANWVAVTVPSIMGACQFKRKTYSGSFLNVQRGMRKKMLKRFHEMIGPHTEDIILMTEAQVGLQQQRLFGWRARLERILKRF